MSIYKRTTFEKSDIMRAINALTYGSKCLYFQKTLKQCTIFMHDEFINVLQILILGEKQHIFVELNDIQNITDKNDTTSNKLANYGLKNFIILNTKSFQKYVLVMKTQLQKYIIWEGLQFFVIEGILFFQKILDIDPWKADAMMLFLRNDKKGEKKLRHEEILKILKSMKIKMIKQDLLPLVNKINQDYYQNYSIKKPLGYNKDHMQYETFEKLIKYQARKKELVTYFKDYCVLFDDNISHYKAPIKNVRYYQKPLMAVQQFIHFKKQQHFQTITEQQAKQIIESFIAQPQSKDKKQNMSFFHFSDYIFSPKNSIWDPAKTRVYQDMTQPLCDYYIYSSHNTYLSGDQLKSPSDTRMYELALKKGCRCVELDIHNGANGIPIVKHGGTLTKQILFEDTIRTIKDYSFLTNSFPVVLSFENHCSKDEQIKMAQLIEDIMDDMVYVLPKKVKDYNDMKSFPSPHALMKKIVIKGDGKPQYLYQQQTSNEVVKEVVADEDDGQDEQDINNQKIKQAQKKFTPFELIKPKQVKKQPIKHEIRLMKMVTMFNSKLDLKQFKRLCWNSCSLDQGKVVELLQNKEQQIMKYSGQFLIRTYPSGVRVESSNYDPTPAFNIGAHIIALNLQTSDKQHYLLHSKFIQNGGTQCGYLLKPQWMRSTSKQRKLPSQFSQQKQQLNIKVICGQKLIIKQQLSTPFKLHVYIKGNTFDEKKNTVIQSQVIDNPFDPSFHMNCTFKIFCPDLAMLVFDVVSTKNSQILSSIAVNYNCIREGLRVAPLLGPNMRYGKGSYILVFSKKTKITNLNNDD